MYHILHNIKLLFSNNFLMIILAIWYGNSKGGKYLLEKNRRGLVFHLQCISSRGPAGFTATESLMNTFGMRGSSQPALSAIYIRKGEDNKKMQENIASEY